VKRVIAAALLWALPALAATPPAKLTLEDLPLSLELHAHLFMKEGMGFGFTGDFFGPLKARDWRDQFRSMANPESLERSGIGIVVAALYAHPMFEFSPRESVRKQIALARRFVAEHPNWIIARDAGEARQALLSGRRVMVLALEGASGIIDSEADLEEFVDQGGIRIVNLLHLTDDEFGGVAFLPGLHVLASPWAWLKGLFHSNHDENGTKLNTNGLSDRGRAAALAMIKHGVWLDLAHASDAALKDLMPLAAAHGRPLLYTHTVLRKYMKAERGITLAQIEAVKASGGFLGTMPAETMLEGTPVKSPPPCGGNFERFLLQYGEFVAALGPESVAIGSDYNGGVVHLEPACKTGTSLDTEGFWNIGQAGDLWKAMANVGAPVPKPLGKILEKFLQAWERAKKP
jgi:microsomal dipeptidase-like Zn-dependent dipeptidase